MLVLADCAVAVSNAKDTARWWKERLGFAAYTIPGSGHAIMVAPPGDRFVLHLCEGFEEIDPGNTGIAFVTDDIEATVRRTEGAGVEFAEPYSKTDGRRVAKFLDPDGNVFWLLGASSSMVRSVTSAKNKAPRPRRSARRIRRRGASRRSSRSR